MSIISIYQEFCQNWHVRNDDGSVKYTRKGVCGIVCKTNNHFYNHSVMRSDNLRGWNEITSSLGQSLAVTSYSHKCCEIRINYD